MRIACRTTGELVIFLSIVGMVEPIEAVMMVLLIMMVVQTITVNSATGVLLGAHIMCTAEEHAIGGGASASASPST